jgi:predicted transcriptional regulator
MNNSVCSINKNSSIYDAINIIINEDIEELLVWDESLQRWIWMLTIADAIRLIMHSLKAIIN